MRFFYFLELIGSENWLIWIMIPKDRGILGTNNLNESNGYIRFVINLNCAKLTPKRKDYFYG